VWDRGTGVALLRRVSRLSRERLLGCGRGKESTKIRKGTPHCMGVFELLYREETINM